MLKEFFKEQIAGSAADWAILVAYYAVGIEFVTLFIGLTGLELSPWLVYAPPLPIFVASVAWTTLLDFLGGIPNKDLNFWKALAYLMAVLWPVLVWVSVPHDTTNPQLVWLLEIRFNSLLVLCLHIMELILRRQPKPVPA